MLIYFDIWHACVQCNSDICNDCKVYALWKLLGLQEITAGTRHMIHPLNLTNDEAGSQRGKAICLK